MSRSITLTWDAVDGPVDGYNVYRGERENTQSETPLNGANLVKGTSYTDSAIDNLASPDKVFYYKVSAVYQNRESARSAEFRSPALPKTPKNGNAGEPDNTRADSRGNPTESGPSSRNARTASGSTGRNQQDYPVQSGSQASPTGSPPSIPASPASADNTTGSVDNTSPGARRSNRSSNT